MSTPIPFPFAPDGQAALRETLSYATDVLQAYGGSEQRVKLRGIPTHALGYGFTAASPAAAQFARALLLADPEAGYLVPWWPLVFRLNAAAAINATHLYANLSQLPLYNQDGVCRFALWSSSSLCEFVTASSWTSSVVNLTAPLVHAWPSGAILLPVLLAHAPQSPAGRRIGPLYSGGQVSLLADLVTSYALPSGTELYSPAGYLGLDVLTTPPCGDSAPEEPGLRRLAAVEADVGRVLYDSQDSATGASRALLCKCLNAAAVLALKRFFRARIGRLLPFWLPTWDADLTLSSAYNHIGQQNHVIHVVYCGYTDLLYAAGSARRHLQIKLPSGATCWRSIVAANSPDGLTETLTMNTNLTENLAAGTSLCFLRYCRLASDALELSWSGPAYAEATLEAVELACDAPAAA